MKEDELPMSIDKFKILAKWLSHDEQNEEEEEPVAEYNPLDQSLEDSFDWFSSADETENYGDEEDQYDWELESDEFDDEQNDSLSDSSATLLYDSSTSSSILAYDSDDYN